MIITSATKYSLIQRVKKHKGWVAFIVSYILFNGVGLLLRNEFTWMGYLTNLGYFVGGFIIGNAVFEAVSWFVLSGHCHSNLGVVIWRHSCPKCGNRFLVKRVLNRHAQKCCHCTVEEYKQKTLMWMEKINATK